jgi:iron(III) transport system ATP-binding protein
MASVLDKMRSTATPVSTDQNGPPVRDPSPVPADVVVQDVSVAYAGIPAVQAATLEIEAGSIVSLLGPSGCGKTSLLRAIAGLERPTAGTVAISGALVSGPRAWVKPERRNVGMVFQDGSLFPHLSVAENVAFGLRTSGLSKPEQRARVAEMLALVELDGFADRLPETLSGGQQQRVALARSLAPNPSVLLLDEPFSALDAALRTHVRSDVARILRGVGVTTVFVTHDQDEAFVLGDEVAVMRDGHIEQIGTPDELYRTPTTPWVAGFVGEANLLPGSLETARSDPGTSYVPRGRTVATSIGPVPVAADDEGLPDDDQPDRRPDPGELVVLVRPEQVALHDGDDGEIVQVEYYGHDVRYDVALADGTTLIVRTPPSDLRERGDRVCVRFDGAPTEYWTNHIPAT